MLFMVVIRKKKKRGKKMVTDSKVIANNFAKIIFCKFIFCLVWLLSLQKTNQRVWRREQVQRRP